MAISILEITENRAIIQFSCDSVYLGMNFSRDSRYSENDDLYPKIN